MKKTFLFFILIALITYFFNFKIDNFYNYFKQFENAEFCYVLNNSKFEENLNELNLIASKVINNGNKKHLYFKTLYKNSKIQADYKQVNLKIDLMQFNKILKDLNIKILFEERVDDLFVIYGFSSLFKEYKLLNFYKINFQFVISKSSVIIGFPMIYNGF